MDERTRRFLDVAIEREWVTPEQVEECRRIHETVAEVGIDQSIEEILVRKGYLTPDRLRALNRELSVMRVGKYQIVEKVGEGGAGIVYKANQEPLERVVAIKVLSKRRVASERYLERFLREARIAVTLNHQNIVRGLDYGEADGYHYFVMEFVEGESLYNLLKREGMLDEKHALEIASQVVAALKHAAGYNLVHRDVKPENILITDDGVVKLCDLGLAKPSLVETAKASSDGTTIGTPTYMSPEQIRGKDDADFRADVYSLGATLYHMVTGRPPFTGESADIIVRKHLREEITDPRELNLSLSTSAAAVITKMLAKEPERRYSSLEDLADDLSSVLEGRPPTHTIDFGGRPPPTGKVRIEVDEHAPRRSRRAGKKSRAPLAIAGVVALLAIAAAAVFLFGPFGKDEPTKPPEDVAGAAEPEPDAPSPERLAEDLYREAQDYSDRQPDAPFEARLDRYRLVVSKYPQTRFGLLAKDRVRDLEALRDKQKKDRLAKAKRAFETRMAAAASLVATGQYGAAIGELAAYPKEYEDTEYPARLETERKRLLAEAEKRRDEALAEAGRLVIAGKYNDAVSELEKLAAIGIPEIEKVLREKLAEIRAAEKKEREIRERGLTIYRAEVGTAFLKARDGRWAAAENDLVTAQGRKELVYYGEDLSRMWKLVRAARTFADALEKGAGKLAGRSERFALLTPKRPVAAGKVLGGSSAGVRLARGAGEEVIPFASIAPPDLVRIAMASLDPEEAASHVAAAMFLLIQGYQEECRAEIKAAEVLGADTSFVVAAKTLFTNYLKDRADVEILKAEGYRGRGQLKEAELILADTAARTPWYGQARYRLGAVLVELERYEEALPELERALALDVADAQLHYYLGEAWFQTGKPEEALHAFSRFTELAKDAPDSLQRAKSRIAELREKALKERAEQVAKEARDAYRRDDFQEAIRLYTLLQELAPNEDDCLYHLGKAHQELGQIFAAYRRYREYLEADPSGRRAGEVKRILRALEKEYKEPKASKDAVFQAMVEFKSGKYELALSLFDRAIELGPLNEDAYYDRAVTYVNMGDLTGDPEKYAAALADLDRVEFLNPKQKLVNESRAIAYYGLKRYEEALATAKVTIESLPERWQAYNIAGLVYRINGDHEKSLDTFTRGIEKAPDLVLLYINRALTYEDMEEWKKARADLQTASEKNPSAPQIQQISEILDRLIKAENG